MTGPTRKLTAILAADVAGYSRLMGADEEGTLNRLKAHRRELIDPKIAEYRGRIVKTTGDGMLVEFASVVDAVKCAVEIQKAMRERETNLAANQLIQFRIGVNTGDVIIDGDDIHGDGVNVAARLEALAEPGTICLSAAAWDQVRGKVHVAAKDLGEQRLRNIARPVHAFRLTPEAAPERTALPLPDKPSIAVLAFENLSGDPTQDYFSDGLTEDIITALSKWQWFFVIARNSSFIYKGKAVDAKQVGRELGVRYVLEGSIRKAGGTVRVTAQLIDTQSGTHVWAQRYDRGIADVFAIQDEITGQIALALNIELTEAESQRRDRERPGHPEAMDLVLRARALMNRRAVINRMGEGDRGQINEARSLLLKAAELDEATPGLFAELSRTYINDVGYGWSANIARSVSDAMAAADHALKLDPRDATARLWKGVAHRYKGEPEEAMAALRVAHDLNPNHPLVHSHVAGTLIQMGRIEEACEAANRSLRLSPHQASSLLYLGIASFHAERYEESAQWLRKALQAAPDVATGKAYLAAALALAGQVEEAKRVVGDMVHAPTTSSIQKVREHAFLGSAHWHEQLERMYDALRVAGFPE